jgi:hypothetical protein
MRYLGKEKKQSSFLYKQHGDILQIGRMLLNTSNNQESVHEILGEQNVPSYLPVDRK